jgi:putative SOS response-associated peptidase YedK
MLKPFPAEQMKTYPVTGRVNSPDNDSPDLIIPVDLRAGQTMSLFS